jgi:hypothetical protein
MTMRLADRLSAARHRQFVGRDNERSLFQAALESPELPFYVLHVYGPGGVGKTTLLKEFGAICERLGVAHTYIDARNVEPAPDSFVAALQMAMGVTPPQSPLDALAARGERHVILIDTYETLVPLDGWLRETFLPEMPADTLMILAARHAPAPAWRADPGWQNLIKVVPLRNLTSPKSSIPMCSASRTATPSHYRWW